MIRPLKNNGFTITELAIATLVGMMAFTVLFYISFTLQDNIRITSEILRINENGRNIVSILSRDIREAKSTLSSFSTYSSDASTLILRTPSIKDSSGELLTTMSGAISSYDILIYTINPSDSEQLIRHTFASVGSYRNSGIETVAKKIQTFTVSDFSESVSIEVYTKASLVSTTQGRIKTSCVLRNNERAL